MARSQLGVVFHYDLHVFDGLVYGQGNNRINPIEDYNIFPSRPARHRPVDSVGQSCRGQVCHPHCHHETGFGLWQSDVNPYCMKALKWRDGKGDIVRDFVNSCRKYGVQPGIYIGIRWNSLLGIHNFKARRRRRVCPQPPGVVQAPVRKDGDGTLHPLRRTLHDLV